MNPRNEDRKCMIRVLKRAWKRHPALTLGEVVTIAAQRIDGTIDAWDAGPDMLYVGLRALARLDVTPRVRPPVGPTAKIGDPSPHAACALENAHLRKRLSAAEGRLRAAGKWTDAVLVAMGRDPKDGDAGDDADEAIREAFDDCRLQREADANCGDDLVKAGLYGSSRERIAEVCADSRAVMLLVREFLGPLNDALMARDADGAFVHAQAVNQAIGLVASMLNNERPALPRPVVLAVEADDGDVPF